MSFPAVDTVLLGLDPMPGNWVLQPTYKEFGWQIQKGIGLSGATVRPIGDELVVATFLVQFITEADWDAFQPFRKKYLSKAVFKVGSQKSYAVGIFHPELHALGVTSVVPRKVPVFTNSGKGRWFGTVEFLQYRKPQPVLESPLASIPAAAAPNPSAADSLEREQQLHQAQISDARAWETVGPP